MSGAEGPAQQLARELLDRTRAEVDRADNKASIVLAAVLAVAGALVATGVAVGWSPARSPVLVQVFFWPGALGGLAGIALLGAAVYPRMRVHPPETRTLGYFGDVVALRSVDGLRAALRDPAARSFDGAVDQIWQVSHIVDRKYRLIRGAVLGLTSSAVLLLLAGVAAGGGG